ncbi:MAG: hypothetical protein AB7P49_12155, partial [Bdellovibrionales bacterium]
HGGSNTGGGSRVLATGELVDAYGGHSISEIPGLEYAAHKLRQFVPRFVDEQLRNISKKNIHFMPAKLKPLPAQGTDLHFDTDNPCYQTRNEMFCDINTLRGKHPSLWENFFIHELVMAAHLDRGGSSSLARVRAASRVLIRPDLTYPMAEKALQEHSLAHPGDLVPAEYIQSIHLPQGSAQFPHWAAPIKPVSCAWYGQTSTFYRGNASELNFNYPMWLGNRIAIYNGYMYLFTVSPLWTGDMELRRDIYALVLQRELTTGYNETLYFICPRTE